jgi:hypothetical protein
MNGKIESVVKTGSEIAKNLSNQNPAKITCLLPGKNPVLTLEFMQNSFKFKTDYFNFKVKRHYFYTNHQFHFGFFRSENQLCFLSLNDF